MKYPLTDWLSAPPVREDSEDCDSDDFVLPEQSKKTLSFAGSLHADQLRSNRTKYPQLCLLALVDA